MRALDPAWVKLLAEEIQADGQVQPIRVVERGARFQLIDGARRVAACLQLGHTGIEAAIEPEAALANDAFVRLGEIKGNFLRAELTMLERAYYVAAWRAVYEGVNGVIKRGPKPRTGIPFQRNEIPEAGNDDVADAFVLSLSEAAQKALQISQPTMSRYLRIASIPTAQGHRLVGHQAANSRAELLVLAEQTAARQVSIIDMLTAAEPRAATVAEAIIALDGTPAAARLSPSEKIHQTFSRLRPQDQERFFDLNAEAIERWSAARGASRRASGRGAA
ncbi:ParB N-terminal domain-containing protein [Methylobacterium sp. SyP6R]|uniref:ParB N-terminal domain-containing protein n=1 Tax=Methylobacterium sp. SyP6R TaxID=2718876 RepID=UPI001F3ED7A2|nr:ParB N-terminal domain-containing protein [Methylobacterium sp. SyP6R]MCF4125005.1 ParB N-terminal domain-containing protein [Methylobacterium sp. SyP6R]